LQAARKVPFEKCLLVLVYANFLFGPWSLVIFWAHINLRLLQTDVSLSS